MNIKQINLLKKNDYEVLPEIGYVKEITMLQPIASIWFNNLTKVFYLNIIGSSVKFDELTNYQQEINKKINLVIELNNLKGE